MALRQIYAETNQVYDLYKRQLGANDLGFKILYGPPHRNAPILFVGDQPGGAMADEKAGERFGWPGVCEYATESWPLARKLRVMFGKQLLQSCVGVNANFFRAPRACAWQTVTESVRNALEEHCRTKLMEIIHLINPKRIVIIGHRTLDTLGSSYPVLRNAGSRRVLVKAGHIGRWPAVSTLHLSGARIAHNDRHAIAQFILQPTTGAETEGKPITEVLAIQLPAPDRQVTDGVIREGVVAAAVEEAGPRQMIVILKELKELGISNDAVRRLHQSGKTFRSVEAYCEATVSRFNNNDNNERLQRRLEYVAKSYVALGVPPGRSDVFRNLAEVALTKIPPRPSR